MVASRRKQYYWLCLVHTLFYWHRRLSFGHSQYCLISPHFMPSSVWSVMVKSVLYKTRLVKTSIKRSNKCLPKFARKTFLHAKGDYLFFYHFSTRRRIVESPLLRNGKEIVREDVDEGERARVNDGSDVCFLLLSKRTSRNQFRFSSSDHTFACCCG